MVIDILMKTMILPIEHKLILLMQRLNITTISRTTSTLYICIAVRAYNTLSSSSSSSASPVVVMVMINSRFDVIIVMNITVVFIDITVIVICICIAIFIIVMATIVFSHLKLLPPLPL